MGWSFYLDWLSPYVAKLNPAEASYTGWLMPFPPHWHLGGVSILVIVAAVIGVIAMVTYNILRPAFFRGEVLNERTPTLVPELTGLPAGFPPSIGRDDVPPNAPLVPPGYESSGPNRLE
jgi:hypothetical protein